MAVTDLTTGRVRRRAPPSIDRLLIAIQRSGHQPQSIRVSGDEIEIQFRESGEHSMKVEQAPRQVDDWFAKREK